MKKILYLTTLLTLFISTGCVSRSDHHRAVKKDRDDEFRNYDQDTTKGPNAFHQRPDERDLDDN